MSPLEFWAACYIAALSTGSSSFNAKLIADQSIDSLYEAKDQIDDLEKCEKKGDRDAPVG